jgi:poly(3-hydroxybutyrate) depolymerase
MKAHGHGTNLSYYHFGATTLFASRLDQRFSYCLYVPESYREDGDAVYPLAVAVHGTDRTAQGYRDALTDWAEEKQCIVLAPLFPAGVDEPAELNNYKYLEYNGIRFDLLLLDMVDEISELYRLDSSKFLLTGFSGGGHFTHRFLLTHPDRVLGASIGAPGVVTLLDETRQWPAGVAGLGEALGITLDIDEIAKVPVQMVVGGDDTETWEIGVNQGEPIWIEGVNDHGVNRQTKMLALKASFESHGVTVRHDVVPGVAHVALSVFDTIGEFFSDVLATRQTVGER